ncbi:hypothetical protein [Loktanella fryxellensis]|uniref:hypothetical protein n=1 Tax=Loktanella fryxellensis TaxID=245187 RepID=UPI00116005C2|nr:hypothetical protein [Loktanella fryxellensis]
MAQIGARFAETVYGQDGIGLALADFLRVRPDPDTRDLDEMATRFLTRHPDVRSIVFAPDLVVSQVYPENIYRNLVSIDYTAFPERMTAIDRAIAERGPIFDHQPLNLNSEPAYIIRYPVFVPDDATGAERV